MSRLIVKYVLNAVTVPQSVNMPRRARILYLTAGHSNLWLFAEVLEDADTKAFDVQHVRHFVAVSSGGAVPEGAGYIGSCHGKLNDFHVYETRPPSKAMPL